MRWYELRKANLPTLLSHLLLQPVVNHTKPLRLYFTSPEL